MRDKAFVCCVVRVFVERVAHATSPVAGFAALKVQEDRASNLLFHFWRDLQLLYRVDDTIEPLGLKRRDVEKHLGRDERELHAYLSTTFEANGGRAYAPEVRLSPKFANGFSSLC